MLWRDGSFLVFPGDAEYSNPYNHHVKENAAWIRAGRGMALGAAYDVVFATAILAFPHPASRLLRIPVPDDPVYFNFTAVFLLILASVWYLAARSPRQYRGVILVACAGRALGAAYLFAIWRSGAPVAFAGLAAGDLFFSLLHGLTYRLASRADRESR